MKQLPFILTIILAISCKHVSSDEDEFGWQLMQATKYTNSLDMNNRVIEATSRIYIYSNGEEVGNDLYEKTLFEYNSAGKRTAERRFNVDDQGLKTLKAELINYYDQKGQLISTAHKLYGLLLDSSIYSYDEKGLRKIEAIISIKTRPKDADEAKAIIANKTASYDTSFVYHVYQEDGTLMDKYLNSNSKLLSTKYFEYQGKELKRSYWVSQINDTLEKQFYEKDRNGILKETSSYADMNMDETIWKKGDKIIKAMRIGDGLKTMTKYKYDKYGNIVEERKFY